MGQVIIGTSFNPGLLAKPGYCTRVKMNEVDVRDVKHAARNGVKVLAPDATDIYSKALLTTVLLNIGVDAAGLADEHCLNIGDTLYVCPRPEARLWFSVTLASDAEVCLDRYPELRREVDDLHQLFAQIGGPIAFLPERVQSRMGAGLALKMRRVSALPLAQLANQVIQSPKDDAARRNLVIKLAMARVE